MLSPKFVRGGPPVIKVQRRARPRSVSSAPVRAKQPIPPRRVPLTSKKKNQTPKIESIAIRRFRRNVFSAQSQSAAAVPYGFYFFGSSFSFFPVSLLRRVRELKRAPVVYAWFTPDRTRSKTRPVKLCTEPSTSCSVEIPVRIQANPNLTLRRGPGPCRKTPISRDLGNPNAGLMTYDFRGFPHWWVPSSNSSNYVLH